MLAHYLKEFSNCHWICDLIAISHFTVLEEITMKIRFNRLWRPYAFLHSPKVLPNHYSICNSLEGPLVPLVRSLEAWVSSGEGGGQPRPNLSIVNQLQRCIWWTTQYILEELGGRAGRRVLFWMVERMLAACSAFQWSSVRSPVWRECLSSCKERGVNWCSRH